MMGVVATLFENSCTPPPMLFETLKDAMLEKDMLEPVNALLELKKTTPELGEGPRINVLNDYIDKNIAELENIINSYPLERNRDWNKLNALFLSLL